MSKRKRNEDLILAQWQTYVEMANSVSQRRGVMNNAFITLNLALLTAVSLAWDIKICFYYNSRDYNVHYLGIFY